MSSLFPYLSHLQSGGCVVIPTETVYGLAADATSLKGIESIYRIKGRPRHNPLIIHVASLDMAQEYAVWDERALNMAYYFWLSEATYKPITFVLPKKYENLPDAVTAGLETVAVRMPRHPLTLNLITAYGLPLAAPSANPSQKRSLTTHEAIEETYGNHPEIMVLKGGPCHVGLESTIVDLSLEIPLILRQGGCPLEDLEIFGVKLPQPDSISFIRAPGMMSRHYTPDLTLCYPVTQPDPHDVWITFGSNTVMHTGPTLNLSQSGSLEEASHNFYEVLRQADRLGLEKQCAKISVSSIPQKGLGAAIHDRLTRASTAE